MNVKKVTLCLGATTIFAGLIGLASPIAIAFDWKEGVVLKGDFRFRYEGIDDSTKEHVRHRNRIRLRLGLDATINNQLKIGAGFSSGGDDPVSTNQTLSSQSSTKDLRLDLAYFAWQPIKHFTIKGGKIKNPFYFPMQTELLWDSDIRPEGLSIQYNNKALFFNGGFFHVEERSNDGDSLFFAGQIGYTTSLSNDVKITFGTGYFDYSGIKGHSLDDFKYIGIEENSFGNSLDENNAFINDYNEVEMFADVTFKVGNLPFTIFANYVINTAAAENDTAYLAGFKLGKTKKANSFDFRYIYSRIESDAVFATFNDSDFIGGETNGKGHEFNFGYQIMKAWKFSISYLDNEKGLENSTDYDRIQVDLNFKF